MRAYRTARGARRLLVRAALGVGVSAGVALLGAGFMGALRRSARPAAPAASLPAPPIAPAAAPAPQAEPGEITITFESDPPGAEAHLVGHDEPLGVTPFDRRFPRGDDTLAVELTRAGYEPVRVSAATAASRTISVTLRAVPSPAQPPAAQHHTRPGHRLDSETTIDPFK
jgi:hypothetical protein